MSIVRVRRGKRRAPVGGVRESIPPTSSGLQPSPNTPCWLVNRKGREDDSNFVGPVTETFSTLLIHLEVSKMAYNAVAHHTPRAGCWWLADSSDPSLTASGIHVPIPPQDASDPDPPNPPCPLAKPKPRSSKVKRYNPTSTMPTRTPPAHTPNWSFCFADVLLRFRCLVRRQYSETESS